MITEPALKKIEALERGGKAIRHLVIGYVNDKSRHDRADDWLLVTPHVVTNIESLVPRSVIDRANAFLVRLAEAAGCPGAKVVITPKLQWPWAYARDGDELISYIEHLHEAGFLQWHNPAVMRAPRGGEHKITVRGWQHLEEIRRPNPRSDKGFIAMSFSKDKDDLKNLRERVIEPAIAYAGYYPVVVSREYVDRIDDGIVVNIREARFVIADFTEQRQNVYYEAGFARGLGIKVISLCREDEIAENRLHFDTRQYKHIPWDLTQLEVDSQRLAELRQTLSEHIIESVGRGPNSPQDVLSRLAERPKT